MNNSANLSSVLQSEMTRTYSFGQLQTVGTQDDAVFAVDTAVPVVVYDNNSLSFLFIPLAVLLGILLLSAVVYLMARSRRRSVNRRRRFNGGYNNIPVLEQNIIDDSFDDPTECLLKGKLEIDNRYETFNTLPASHTVANNRELYT